MKLEEIKKHWQKWAKEFSCDLRATTKTSTIKRLEIDALYRAIKKTGLTGRKNTKVLEVGCGNGYNCFALSGLLPNFSFTGIDYSPLMIENAKKLKKKTMPKAKILFTVANILNLEAILGRFDIVFTDRCLINLNTRALQKKAFDQLVKKVKKGGYLIILENFLENYGRQNYCRLSVGLPKRKPASFNLFLNKKFFLSLSKKNLKLLHVDDFGSLHDIILYVLIPMLNKGEIDYNNAFTQAATDFLAAISEKYPNAFGSFGQNRLFLFKKR